MAHPVRSQARHTLAALLQAPAPPSLPTAVFCLSSAANSASSTPYTQTNSLSPSDNMPITHPWDFLDSLDLLDERQQPPKSLFDLAPPGPAGAAPFAAPTLIRVPSTASIGMLLSPRDSAESFAWFDAALQLQEPTPFEFGNMLLTDVPMRSVSVGGPAVPASSSPSEAPTSQMPELVLTSHPALKYPEAVPPVSSETAFLSAAPTAVPGLGDSSTEPPVADSDENRPVPHGVYSKAQRKAAIARFHEKRKNRTYRHVVRYQSRKRFADRRLRVGGRFVKIHTRPDELFSSGVVGVLPQPQQAQQQPQQYSSGWSNASPSLKPLAAVDSQLKSFSL